MIPTLKRTFVWSWPMCFKLALSVIDNSDYFYFKFWKSICSDQILVLWSCAFQCYQKTFNTFERESRFDNSFAPPVVIATRVNISFLTELVLLARKMETRKSFSLVVPKLLKNCSKVLQVYHTCAWQTNRGITFGLADLSGFPWQS